MRERKTTYRKRLPAVVNLISGLEIERLLRNGFAGKALLPPVLRQERRALARACPGHFPIASFRGAARMQNGALSR